MSKSLETYRAEMNKLDKANLINLLVGIYATLGPVTDKDGALHPGASFEDLDPKVGKGKDYTRIKNLVWRNSSHSPTRRNAGATQANAIALVQAGILPHSECGFTFSSYATVRDTTRAMGLTDEQGAAVAREAMKRSIPEGATTDTTPRQAPIATSSFAKF